MPGFKEDRGPAAGEPCGPRDLVRAAAWFGMVAGWLELAAVAARRAIDPRISMDSLRTNRNFAWMIPLSDLLIFVAVGLLVGGVARRRPGVARWVGWRLYPALAAMALVLTVQGLTLVACAALAGGVGALLGPMLQRRAGRIGRLARASLPAMGAALALLSAAWVAWLATAERRALAGLPGAAPGAPNVLLIVLDNVRAASTSLHGHDRPTTPRLERLAAEGVRFTTARATAPWTLPSHASMFTGQWSHKLSVGWDRPLDASYPTLAEFLAGRGYATAGFVGNTYYGNARYGLGRGFARYEDYYENQSACPFEVVHSSGLGRLILRALGYTVKVEEGGTALRKTAAMLNRDALAWLDARPRGRPFFVFLNYFDAHSPFIPPEGPDPRFGLCALPEKPRMAILKRYQRLLAKQLAPGDGPPERVEREAIDVFRDSYESCIAYLDRQLGRLFDELDRRGLREDTLVIVTSDHGEHFQERGFRGHGMSLYGREVHVPLLIFPPSPSHARRVVAEPVSLRDLPATVVDLLGLSGQSPFPGRSLARCWRPEDAAGRGPACVLSEVGHHEQMPPTPVVPSSLGPVKSLVSAGKVYIRNGDGREELYDLRGDPLEADNLADEADAEPSVAYFRELLGRVLAGDDPPGAPPAGRDTLVGENGR
jgi:arylsulfatase A-like enzyme